MLRVHLKKQSLCFALVSATRAAQAEGLLGEQACYMACGKRTRLAAEAVTQGPSPALAKSSAVTSST